MTTRKPLKQSHIQLSSVLATLTDDQKAKESEETVAHLLSLDQNVNSWAKIAELICSQQTFFDFIQEFKRR